MPEKDAMQLSSYDQISVDGIHGGDATLITKCEEMYTESETWMGPTRDRWRKNDKLMDNDVTVQGPRTGTKMKFNLSLAVIETMMPIISDYFPTFDVQPQEADDVAYADMMQLRKGQIEKRAKLKRIGLQTVRDSKVKSNGITRVLPKFKKFPGDDGNENVVFQGVSAKTQDIYTWFPAPDSTGMDIRTEARFQCFAYPMHVDAVYSQYKVKVQPEGNIDKHKQFSKVKESTESNAKYALVKELYRMDPNRKKYPHGRVTIWAGNTLISDEPLWGSEVTEDDDWKRIPYFMVKNYGDAHTIIGVGEPELIKTQIKSLNEVMSGIADNIKKTGNPIALITTKFKAGLKKALSFVTGRPIEVNRPDDVKWLEPPSIPGYTFNFVDKLLQLVDVITGVHDVTEGRKPAGVTAASAIMALQEAAQARVRYTVANEVSDYIEAIGRYITGLIQEYDDDIRYIRVATETGEWDFKEFNPVDALDAEGRREGDEGYDPSTARTMKQSRFDIEVVAGVRMPAGRFATEQIAAEKFQQGIYGIEDYAVHSNEPDKKALIQRWYKRNGLKELKERQDALGEAQGQFAEIAQMAAEDPAFQGSPEEDQAGELVQQFPELLNTEEFQAIPPDVRDRLLAVFGSAEVA